MASSTARLLLKSAKSFSQFLRNPLLSRPNPEIFQSLINPTGHKLYLQRPLLKDGFNFVHFVRGKHSTAFDRMGEALGKTYPIDDKDESSDEYDSDDEVEVNDSDLKDSLSSGDDSDEDCDDDDDDNKGKRR